MPRESRSSTGGPLPEGEGAADVRASGTWSTNHGELLLHRIRDFVIGDYADRGVMLGRISGSCVAGVFTNGDRTGWFDLAFFSRNGEFREGSWGWVGESMAGQWELSAPEKMTPPLDNATADVSCGSPAGTSSTGDAPTVEATVYDQPGASGGESHRIQPLQRGMSVQQFYDYRDDASHTGLEAERTSRFLLYRNTDTGDLSLVFLNGSSQADVLGRARLGVYAPRYRERDFDWHWRVQDDPPELRVRRLLREGPVAPRPVAVAAGLRGHPRGGVQDQRGLLRLRLGGPL